MTTNEHPLAPLPDSMDAARILLWHERLLAQCRRDVESARGLAYGGADANSTAPQNIVRRVDQFKQRVRMNSLLVARVADKRARPYPCEATKPIQDCILELMGLVTEVESLAEFTHRLSEDATGQSGGGADVLRRVSQAMQGAAARRCLGRAHEDVRR